MRQSIMFGGKVKPTASKPARPSSSEVTDVEVLPATKGTGADYLLYIHQGGKFSMYWLRKLVSQFGLAFEFRQSSGAKIGPNQKESYDVCIEPEGDTCDCIAHARFGRCKHVAALRLALDKGLMGDLWHIGESIAPDPDTLGEPCGQCFPEEPPF